MNGSMSDNSVLVTTETFENGTRYEKNGLVITVLQGNYREMGRQYGALYRNELTQIDTIMKTQFVSTPGITVAGMEQKGSNIFDAYPQRYKEIMYGMAETSNLSLADLQMINAMELYIPSVATRKPAAPG